MDISTRNKVILTCLTILAFILCFATGCASTSTENEPGNGAKTVQQGIEADTEDLTEHQIPENFASDISSGAFKNTSSSDEDIPSTSDKNASSAVNEDTEAVVSSDHSDSPEGSSVLALEGSWHQSNAEDGRYMTMTIENDLVTCEWVEDGDMVFPYWKGTYEPVSSDADAPQMWFSYAAPDEDGPYSASSLISKEDVKKFSYKDGMISTTDETDGVRTYIEMEKIG